MEQFQNKVKESLEIFRRVEGVELSICKSKLLNEKVI